MSRPLQTELTSNQKKALEYIHSCVKKEGFTPTLRELASYMGYSAIGSAQEVVRRLRLKGLLLSCEGRQKARDLRLTPQAISLLGLTGDPTADGAVLVPCLGVVPAGNPLEAVEEKIGDIRVSLNNFSGPAPSSDRLFGVRATGYSMVDAGILDGDWLVVEWTEAASPKEIVVARFEDEVTVKRLMWDDDEGWYLKPENPDFSVIKASERPFRVIGRVVALQRYLH